MILTSLCIVDIQKKYFLNYNCPLLNLKTAYFCIDAWFLYFLPCLSAWYLFFVSYYFSSNSDSHVSCYPFFKWQLSFSSRWFSLTTKLTQWTKVEKSYSSKFLFRFPFRCLSDFVFAPTIWLKWNKK